MYTIQWEAWKDLDGCREFMIARKSNLKHTQVIWLITGQDIDPYWVDCVKHKQSPILIWLN